MVQMIPFYALVIKLIRANFLDLKFDQATFDDDCIVNTSVSLSLPLLFIDSSICIFYRQLWLLWKTIGQKC